MVAVRPLMNLQQQDEEWRIAERKRKSAEVRKLLAWEAERELAVRSLFEFVKQAWPLVEPNTEFIDNWHIRAVCAHLEAVGRGEIKQLMINVPPGTMKSLLVCVFWPAWTWIKEPWRRFMHSSYAETLSLRDSVKARFLITSAWYQSRWSLELVKLQDTRLENARGGWRIVGSITGKGIGEHPDYNVADDPHNVLQAESDAERAQVTRWFEGVFCVRGEVRDVSRVLVMQRLHHQDCAGVALEKGGWAVLCLPMRWEADHPTATLRSRPTPLGFTDPRTGEGELLWPAVYSDAKVRRLENNMGIYAAAGQLQQRPSPRSGGAFQRAWFEVLDEVPELVRAVRYWDKAGTKGGKGARTAGVALGEYVLRKRRRWIVLDVIADRWAAPEREQVIEQTAGLDETRWGCPVHTWVEQEPGSGGKESAESTVSRLAGHRVSVERVTGSKELRAEPLSAQASVGNVALLKGAWNAAFLEELEAFPVGARKDMVDGASGAFNQLAGKKKKRIGALFGSDGGAAEGNKA